MSYASIGPGGPSWRVIAVADGTGQDATGRFTTGRNVTYQLSTGPTGTVFIPSSAMTEETVAAAIQADAAVLHNIANLSSG